MSLGRRRHLGTAVWVVAFVLTGAVWAEELGKIDFPASGKPEARPHFLTGVLLLHSFEYVDAAEAFREAQKLDPDFVMAYWGEAMTHNHPLWSQQNRNAARRALEKLAATPEQRLAKAKTERERGYLQAVEALYGPGDKRDRDYLYESAMAELAAAFPDDLEAASFHALSILGTSHDQRDYAKYMRAAAIVEAVYEKSKQHPGALHYLIHCYDDPVHSPLGLRAAERYAKVAPDASHALHMPSHIFVALGMWDRVVASNFESAAAADARRARKKLGVNARGFHALWWLHYGYLQQGRFGEADKLLADMRRDVEKSGSIRARNHLVYMRAHYVIETESWNSDALKIEVDLSDVSRSVAARDLFVRGMAAVKTGDLAGAKSLHAVMLGSPIGVEGQPELNCYPAGGVIGGSSARDRTGGVMVKELEALIAFHEGDADKAIALMKEAVAMDEEINYMFGPPVIVKPTHELLGEMLLAKDKPEQAKPYFETALKRAPGRYLALRGLAESAKRLKDREKADEIQARIKSMRRHADGAVAPASSPSE